MSEDQDTEMDGAKAHRREQTEKKTTTISWIWNSENEKVERFREGSTETRAEMILYK